jgi:hypothetical protein
MCFFSIKGNNNFIQASPLNWTPSITTDSKAWKYVNNHNRLEFDRSNIGCFLRDDSLHNCRIFLTQSTALLRQTLGISAVFAQRFGQEHKTFVVWLCPRQKLSDVWHTEISDCNISATCREKVDKEFEIYINLIQFNCIMNWNDHYSILTRAPMIEN